MIKTIITIGIFIISSISGFFCGIVTNDKQKGIECFTKTFQFLISPFVSNTEKDIKDDLIRKQKVIEKLSEKYSETLNNQ